MSGYNPDVMDGGFFEKIPIHNTAVVAAGDGGRTDCADEAAGEAEDAEGVGSGREGT